MVIHLGGGVYGTAPFCLAPRFAGPHRRAYARDDGPPTRPPELTMTAPTSTRIFILFDRDHERDRANLYTRFGHPLKRLDRGRRIAFEYYAPGEVFSYVRWQSNDYGTERWEVFICQAPRPGEKHRPVPWAKPGVIVLLHAAGVAQVRRFWAMLDQIAKQEIDAADVSPEFYRLAHVAISSGLNPPAYTKAKHAAHLLRRKSPCVFGKAG